jgi:hypothetical protein
MPTYTLSNEDNRDIKRSLSKVLPIIAVAVIGPLAMAYAFDHRVFFFLLAMYTFIVVVAITIAVLRRSRFQLTIDQNQLTLQRPGKPVITILRCDIKSIVENPQSGITVFGNQSNENIFIPHELDGYEFVKSELNSWRAIGPEPAADNRQLKLIISLIVISSVAAVGAFLFKIIFFFFIFIASFLAIAIFGISGTFKESFKKHSEGQRKVGVVQRTILILVVVYFVYKIIISFF